MQIPDYFKFFNKTRIISGKKALENIPYELQSMDSVKPLVVTDKRSVDEGLAKILIDAYGDSGLVIGAVFDGVTGYTSTKAVLDAAQLFRARGCDSIIAMGGENCAFTAKALNLLVSYKTDDLLQFDSLPDNMHLRPFIVIPTSDSSGRETSTRSVIDGRIYESDELMPDIAVIDPRMLKKRGKAETILPALRAMAEAVEACTEDAANPMNDSFAFASIQLICENLAAAVNGGGSVKARLGLANGIAISGIVWSNAPEGIGSALAEELAMRTGNSRELCAAILLPHTLDYKLKNTKKSVRGELLLPVAGIDRYCAAAEAERGLLGVEEIFGMVKGMSKHIPVTLKELNIPRYILESTAEAVEDSFAKMYGKGGALMILESAYNGDGFSGGKK
jgi:alcohol dehydrogenase